MTARAPLTAPEIDAQRSERGGWTRATLAGWGVPWPPPKGWRKALLRGETPEYRLPRETMLAEAVEAARDALRGLECETPEVKQYAERWLLVAYKANRGPRL